MIGLGHGEYTAKAGQPRQFSYQASLRHKMQQHSGDGRCFLHREHLPKKGEASVIGRERKMKLKDGFEIMEISDTNVLVPVGDVAFKGVMNMNSSARFVVECLREETTKAAVLEKMKEKYDAPEQMLVSALDKVLEQLRGIHALDE